MQAALGIYKYIQPARDICDYIVVKHFGPDLVFWPPVGGKDQGTLDLVAGDSSHRGASGPRGSLLAARIGVPGAFPPPGASLPLACPQ